MREYIEVAIQSGNNENTIQKYVSITKDWGLIVNEDYYKLLLEYCIGIF
jgi:hypothetical protein